MSSRKNVLMALGMLWSLTAQAIELPVAPNGFKPLSVADAQNQIEQSLYQFSGNGWTGYIDFRGVDPADGKRYYQTHWGPGVYTLSMSSSGILSVNIRNTFDGYAVTLNFNADATAAADSSGRTTLRLITRRYTDPAPIKSFARPQIPDSKLAGSLFAFSCAGWDGYVDFVTPGTYRSHWNFNKNGKSNLNSCVGSSPSCFTDSAYTLGVLGSRVILRMSNVYDPYTFTMAVSDDGTALEGTRSDGLVCTGKLLARDYHKK